MKLRTIIATAATAAVLASSGVAIAGATTSTDSNTTPTAKTAPATDSAKPTRARHFRMRRHLRRLVKGAAGVVTKAIGIDRKTLRQEIRSGKTIAQIATDHGVQPQAVIDALVAAANKKIDAAVAAHKLTPERAARIEARLPARITKLVNEWHPKRLRKQP